MYIEKIKAVLFDLDGVLIDAKKIHFDALNDSLQEINPAFCITWEEHLTQFDGLKTREKLNLLTESKGLPIAFHQQVWDKKQSITIQKLSNIKENQNLINVLKKLKEQNLKIACCSNSIRNTVYLVLSKLGIIQFFNLILSNEDVRNSKPHPEIYWKAVSEFEILPCQALIIEDSPVGLLAANRSNCNVLRICNSKEIEYNYIMSKIQDFSQKDNQRNFRWTNPKMNILIPMAGAGSRFEKAGYVFPKPLIEVKNKPMIQLVVENLNISANFIYIVQKSHREKYNLDTLLNLITPGCKIIEVNGITEGAACTALMAKELINNDNPLFFANSDQYVNWDSNEFMYKMQESNVDGGMVTFKATHPKWSFAKVDEAGYVTEVAEKNPISDIATCGLYYWKKGSDFVKYAEQMIAENIRVNNEFYVCPVFNQAIKDNKKIKTFNISGMWGLGTPEDLNYFLENYKHESR